MNRFHKKLLAKLANINIQIIGRSLLIVFFISILYSLIQPLATQKYSHRVISRVKKGLVEGVKECSQAYLKNPESTPTFSSIQSFTNSEYNEYHITTINDSEACFGAIASSSNRLLPTLSIIYDEQAGSLSKVCTPRSKAAYLKSSCNKSEKSPTGWTW